MKNRAVLTFALSAHTLYFALAAAAGIYCVAEAWHYGFWFTPFPLLLTLVALFFVGGCAVGCFYLFSGWVRVLSLIAVGGLWTAAAMRGSYFCSHGAMQSTLTWFIPIVVAALSATMILLHRQHQLFTPGGIAPACHNAVRLLSLLIPIPLFAYASLSLYANAHTDGCRANINANLAFVRGERFFFGGKRAHEQLAKRFAIECKHGHCQVAQEYARQAFLMHANRR